jgi:hypothetical protein
MFDWSNEQFGIFYAGNAPRSDFSDICPSISLGGGGIGV